MMTPDLNDYLQQGNAVSAVIRQVQNRTIVHAVLITGEKGTGKKTLADLLAKSLLCKGDGTRPCGECASCRQFDNSEHPDCIVIRSGQPIASEIRKDRTTIPVDDIREMIRITATHAFEGGNRVVIIRDADAMTPAAQNCLLKTLEEPPENTFFLLATDQTDRLLPTVISRCRLVQLHAWDDMYILKRLNERGVAEDRASQALAEANGSPGTALKIAGDETYWALRHEVIESFFGLKSRSEILKTSSGWKDRKNEADIIFTVLESVVENMLKSRVCSKKELVSFLPEQWIRFSETCDLQTFCNLFDKITEARKQAASSVNFQALIEQLLFSFMEEIAK